MVVVPASVVLGCILPVRRIMGIMVTKLWIAMSCSVCAEPSSFAVSLPKDSVNFVLINLEGRA